VRKDNKKIFQPARKKKSLVKNAILILAILFDLCAVIESALPKAKLANFRISVCNL
jgi:type IV secretory pathway component VirB8